MLVTLLTPAGRGAVATVSIDGPGCSEAVKSFFRPISNAWDGTFEIGRIVVGRWHSSALAAEEVVVCRRSERRIEVNCHGGHAACSAILESLVSAGARQSEPELWLGAHHLDAIQQDAWLALRHAPTPRTASILLDQFRGAFSARLKEIFELIESADWYAAIRGLQELVNRAAIGLHLVKPWRIVIAGPPNVGKSSLINALSGYERAIVYDEPGTTRDVLAALTALDGWPIELIDTAGLRTTAESIEAEGISRARAEIANANCVVFVTDPETANVGHQEWTAGAKDCLLVANKSDLPIRTEIPSTWLRTSVKTGAGLKQLMQTIVDRIVPDPPQAGEAIPFTVPQVAVLQAMQEALRSGERQAVQRIATQCFGIYGR